MDNNQKINFRKYNQRFSNPKFPRINSDGERKIRKKNRNLKRKRFQS